jgi:hypothetical protein
MFGMFDEIKKLEDRAKHLTNSGLYGDPKSEERMSLTFILIVLGVFVCLAFYIAEISK